MNSGIKIDTPKEYTAEIGEDCQDSYPEFNGRLTIRIPRCPVCKSPMLALRQIGDVYCVSCDECGMHGPAKTTMLAALQEWNGLSRGAMFAETRTLPIEYVAKVGDEYPHASPKTIKDMEE